MSTAPITPHPEITALRLIRYQQFRDCLSAEDQKALDRKIERWCKLLSGCGIKTAQELFIALMEFGGCPDERMERLA